MVTNLKKDQTFTCLSCSKTIPFKAYKGNYHKFCNNKCQREYQYRFETLPRFKEGTIYERRTLRKILIKEGSNTCSCCKLSIWNNLPITLELDHIDGNAGNNMPHNLRLLCPNCHSQTDSWKGGNKGKGRKSLGLPTN